jgi:hypothetical protein
MSGGLHELARRVAHDLGKYATLQARWLPAEASFRERVEAGGADLLRTMSTRDGVRGAAHLARDFLADLEQGGWDAPEVQRLRSALEGLEVAVGSFAALGAVPDDTPENRLSVDEAFAAAQRVRHAAKQVVDATRPPEPLDDLP